MASRGRPSGIINLPVRPTDARTEGAWRFMKQCPGCGKKFNWLQRATGEYREHARTCRAPGGDPGRDEEKLSLAARCRGCPAGCFEEMDYSKYDGDSPLPRP